MKILLTAFEPFGGETVNPAAEAAALLPGEMDGAEIVRLSVPVAFGKSIQTVLSAIDREKPDAVLCVGQAGGRAALTPERVAINISDASMPDQEGYTPRDESVCPDGPAAYFSTLPIRAMTEAIQAAGVPAQISDSAGTYVCNHLMYGVLHHLHTVCPDTLGGFLHVPYLHEQALRHPGSPGLSREDIARGLEAALRVVIQTLRQKNDEAKKSL